MGKIGNITIQTNGGKEVYRSGEEVKGVWRVHVNERVTVNDIYISLRAESYVKWTETNSEPRASDLKFISREEYTNQKKYVVFNKTTLEAGVHEYPFNFLLPTDKMPSSFEGKRGCSRYWLFLKISRSLPWSDVVSDKCITFIDDVNINFLSYTTPITRKKSKRLSKMLGLGDAGEVTLTAKINRTGFCAGEAIPVSVDAVNASKKDLGKLKVSLVQSVVYTANGDSKTEYTYICTKTGSDPIKQGQTRSWKNELLFIDAVPPSTRKRASFCLVVSYYIKVLVDIPLLSGGDLVLWLPITIGTVPQGYKKATPAKGATTATSNIAVVDLSNALTHTRCNRGWEKFNRSTDNAIPEYVCYTPMCVFVPNYTYKPKPLVASPSKQGPARASATVPVKTTQVSKAGSKSATPTPSTSTATKPLSSPSRVQTTGPTPAPTKATATAAQTLTSPSEGQGQVEPSAPPYPYGEDEGYNMSDVSASLPSYEQIFGQGAAESKIEVEETQSGKVFMLIRFKATQREEFTKSLKNYSSGLEKFQGYLSAQQHKATSVNKGNWTKNTLLAVLTFDCADMARDWLKLTPEVCMEKWLGGCDILLVESAEPFQEDHQVLSLSNPILVDTVDDDALARYRHLSNEYMKPARVRIGGVSVASSKVNHCLRGHWDMDIEKSVTILCWPTLDVLRQYKRSVDPEIYQEVVELRGKVFQIRLSVIIQLCPLPTLTNSQEEEGGETGSS